MDAESEEESMNHLKFNFCRECGSKTKDVWVGYYSPKTGKRIMRSECSQNPCHQEHEKVAQPMFSKGDWKCSRCGHIGWYGCGI